MRIPGESVALGALAGLLTATGSGMTPAGDLFPTLTSYLPESLQHTLRSMPTYEFIAAIGIGLPTLIDFFRTPPVQSASPSQRSPSLEERLETPPSGDDTALSSSQHADLTYSGRKASLTRGWMWDFIGSFPYRVKEASLTFLGAVGATAGTYLAIQPLLPYILDTWDGVNQLLHR